MSADFKHRRRIGPGICFGVLFFFHTNARHANIWPNNMLDWCYLCHIIISGPRGRSLHTNHDQNTYLDLFVCDCPIKHILWISISGLWSQWELQAEKCSAFRLQGTAMWGMFRVEEEKSVRLPKCCTMKRQRSRFFFFLFFLFLRFNSLQGFRACVEKWRCNHHPHLTREDPRLSSANSISLSPIPSVFSAPRPSPSLPVSSSSQGFFFSLLRLRPSARDSKQCAFYQGKKVWKYPNEHFFWMPFSITGE